MSITPHRRALFAPKRVSLAFEDAVSRCLKDADANMRAPRSYHVHGRKFVRIWGERDLSTITREDVQQYVETRKREVKPATVLHEMAFLSRVWRVAIEVGAATANPVHHIRRPKVHNIRTRVLSPEEEARIEKAMRPEAFEVVRLALLTGLRRRELFTLRVEHVCLTTGFLHLDARFTKTGAPRSVPLNGEARALVERMIGRRGKWLVFPRQSDRRVVAENFGKHSWVSACRRAGVAGLTFHGLRHTFASRLVMAGANLKAVQAILGHANSKMTDRYVHLSPDFLVEAVGRL